MSFKIKFKEIQNELIYLSNINCFLDMGISKNPGFGKVNFFPFKKFEEL